jgi:hypothetical protein
VEDDDDEKRDKAVVGRDNQSDADDWEGVR